MGGRASVAALAAALCFAAVGTEAAAAEAPDSISVQELEAGAPAPEWLDETDAYSEVTPETIGPEAYETAVFYETDAVRYEVGPMASEDDCGSTSVCLFEHSGLTGSLLQFTNQNTGWLNLSDYGFNNILSSWKNRKSVDAKFAYDPDGNGNRVCMDNNDSDNYVGDTHNDKASSVKVFGSSSEC